MPLARGGRKRNQQNARAKGTGPCNKMGSQPPLDWLPALTGPERGWKSGVGYIWSL